MRPSNPKRLYVVVGTAATPGLYRSDDAGENWTLVTTDDRIAGRSDDEGRDRRESEESRTSSTTRTPSRGNPSDAGKTWTAHRGAPGGDDYQRYWINPNNPNIMLLVADQGAVITVNDGQTWSSWYNQPTAAMYHVAADNAFPYRLCSGQQDSGSACVASRGNDGTIGYREFHPVGVEEYGYAAPDPLNPDLVYGGKVTRYDRRTGQVQQVGPNAGCGSRRRRAAREFFPRGAHGAGAVFADESAQALLRDQRCLGDIERRTSLEAHQSRLSVARHGTVPKNVGNYAGTPADGGHAARRGLHDRAESDGQQHDLGRHG